MNKEQIKSASTAQLKSLAARIAPFAEIGSVEEAEHDAILDELEYRLTHITVHGIELPVKFDHHNGVVWCWRADGREPRLQGSATDDGTDASSWAARDELQAIHDRIDS